MSIIPWVGARRVAIVPVIDLQVDQEPPPDWEYQVHSRVFYDPQPGTSLDQSFQHYLQANSYGRAILEGEVFPLVRAPNAEVNISAMNSLPTGMVTSTCWRCYPTRRASIAGDTRSRIP